MILPIGVWMLRSFLLEVPVYLAGFVQPEGWFLAHLSAAAIIACLPVLLAGWAVQDKLVRGLSMGAVK
jgi:sorbitol/mannitol transport system permease protein